MDTTINQPGITEAKFLAKLKARIITKYGSLRAGAEQFDCSPPLLTMVLSGRRQLTQELRRKILSAGVLAAEDFSVYDFEEVKRTRINNEYVFQIEKLNDIILHQEYMLKLHKEIIEKVYRENENLHSELIKALKIINKLKSGENSAISQ